MEPFGNTQYFQNTCGMSFNHPSRRANIFSQISRNNSLHLDIEYKLDWLLKKVLKVDDKVFSFYEIVSVGDKARARNEKLIFDRNLHMQVR
jgi:hypothetical protein